jgi:hypothetical protein
MNKSTLSLVQELKSADQDFEFYPTDKSMIQTITNDIKKIKEHFDFTNRYSESVKVLDIGSGDGRVLQAIKASFEHDENFKIDTFGIEKASIHTATYRNKDITLIGTEFDQINFISKTCKIGFVNPPYSEFSHWISTLLSHLNFGLLYCVIPERWVNDPAIKEAMKMRGVKYAEILGEADFLTADRAARAKVHIIRFSFDDLNPDNIKEFKRSYRPTVGRDSTDPFNLFIENELGLKKTYSDTTNKFNEYTEKERVRKSMETEGSHSFELVESKGLLWALLENFEIDLARTLEQYKLISKIDAQLLQELGVNYDALRNGAKEKLLGFRNVYWSLLFEKFDALSSRLTGKHKKELLRKLSANALDFTYTNIIYIISYAVELSNELIEESLIDVYKDLTSPEAISRYYVSNEHMYKDDWRYTNDEKQKAKYLLDYRFIHSNWSNFYTESYKEGLNEGAREFCNDLLVAFKLLGYSNLYSNTGYDYMSKGDKLSLMGTTPDGDVIELVQIKFYQNGNRHCKFSQSAMLRLNVTVSRLLGWVRSKEEFATESETTTHVDDNVWDISNEMKVSANNILMLTNQAA